LDGLAHSSLLTGCVAASLVAACGCALDPGRPLTGRGPELGLAFLGTLFVYNVDRLRDLERDRAESPLRSRFVSEHGAGLACLSAAAGLGALAIAAYMGPNVWALCASVLALGLLHRRLKRRARWKPIYVSAAWTAIVVGLPLLSTLSADGALPPGDRSLRVVVCCGSAIAANLIASNLRGSRAPALARVRLSHARWLSGLGAVAALLGPQTVLPLAAVPVAELIALARFRPGERYRDWAVDGALLAGGLASVALSRLAR